MAQTVADRLPDSGESVWGLSVFPPGGRVAGSIQYFMRDALSLDFLQNTFTARYVQDGAEVTAFLSRQPSEEVAVRALEAYRAYISDYGELSDRRQTGEGRLIVGDMGGFYDVVILRGDTVGGVTMVEDRALALKFAEELMAQTR